MRNTAMPIVMPEPGCSIENELISSPLCAEVIMKNPRLQEGLTRLSMELRAVYLLNPRLGRTLASHQRWLLTQVAFALHLEYDPDDKTSGLTVGRLRELITAKAAASRNTVLNFVEEMRHYRYVRDVPVPSGARTRRRRMEVTELASEAMLAWFKSNLSVLDLLDGGNRLDMLARNPAIFRIAQPIAARACVADPLWLEPPAAVGLFQWTEGGALVMDELVTLCSKSDIDETGRFRVGAINIRMMADEFMMSHTHLQRLFRKAAEADVVGWTGTRRKADLWVCADFMSQYRQWQSVKLAHIERAFRQALVISRSEGGLHHS